MYKSPANTLFVGNNVIFVPECHSTNSLALELSPKSTVSDGTIVITDHQTAGRGQRGNTWHAEKGKNLTFSLVLRPSFVAVRDQFTLTMVTALAVTDTINAMLPQPAAIKWPNDILVEEKKICGILIENQVQGAVIQTAIVGIGFNVNQESFAVSNATSLYCIIGRPVGLQDVLDQLLSAFEARYLSLKQKGEAGLREAYLSRLFGRGQSRAFVDGHGEFSGMITGVDDRGRLVVDCAGKLRAFDMKEIQYRL